MKENLLRHLSNIPGKQTKRKIVVLESDDWGSIRMPSKEACDSLLQKGIPVYDNFFSANDGLESNEDLEFLFETLSSIKDKDNNPAVMTPMVIMANPDFEAIENSNFENYIYEPFTTTGLRYTNADRLLNLWKQGCERKVFKPEFHGREHVNVKRWMKGLQDNLPQTRLTFDLRLIGLHSEMVKETRKEYFPAFDIDVPEDLKYLAIVLQDGLQMFKEMLGYEATYFVPPNGPFNTTLENNLYKLGIRYINASKIQHEPLGNDKFKRRLHYLGQKSESGLTYLTRNVIFEPSKPIAGSWVDKALQEISIAFKWNKPAVISSHRVNYVSRVSLKNREHGLKELHLLLKSIKNRWPDVEFKTSSELGSIL